MITEAASPLSTSDGATYIWYINMNPTPTDIADDSGNGNNPSWYGTARPALWSNEGGTVAGGSVSGGSVK